MLHNYLLNLIYYYKTCINVNRVRVMDHRLDIILYIHCASMFIYAIKYIKLKREVKSRDLHCLGNYSNKG